MTDQLYEIVSDLLGNDDKSNAYVRLVDAVGKPSSVIDMTYITHHTFSQAGLELLFENRTKRFRFMIFFLSAGRPVRDGEYETYPGKFLHGIVPEDSREEVQRKMGFEPFTYRMRQDSDFVDCYKLEDREIEFAFEPDHGRMISVALKLLSE